MIRRPKASCACTRSTPNWSGSRTSTSRDDRAPSTRASLLGEWICRVEDSTSPTQTLEFKSDGKVAYTIFYPWSSQKGIASYEILDPAHVDIPTLLEVRTPYTLSHVATWSSGLKPKKVLQRSLNGTTESCEPKQ